MRAQVVRVSRALLKGQLLALVLENLVAGLPFLKNVIILFSLVMTFKVSVLRRTRK
jgi:hypothetical protein